jgi:hypothetical protein
MTRRSVCCCFWLALVAAAAAGSCRTQTPPRFPHTKHLAEIECGGPNQPACLSCASCHQGARDSSLPLGATSSACSPCHDAAEGTVMVASGESARSRPSLVRFAHESHLALRAIRGQCVNCHAGVIEGSGSGDRYPPMAVCLRCHQADFDEANCVPCHRGEQLPRSFMRHDDSWPRRHGPAAKRGSRICNQCHLESGCADCHDQAQQLLVETREPDAVGKHFVHRADYVSRHALEARSRPSDCLRCHTTSSCDACHVQRGVSAARVGSVNPHPIGWLGSDTGSADFHGRAARRNIASCAACHDQGPATNCIPCHRVGGHGGNPHPRGWRSARSTHAAMCRYCHGS